MKSCLGGLFRAIGIVLLVAAFLFALSEGSRRHEERMGIAPKAVSVSDTAAGKPATNGSAPKAEPVKKSGTEGKLTERLFKWSPWMIVLVVLLGIIACVFCLILGLVLGCVAFGSIVWLAFKLAGRFINEILEWAGESFSELTFLIVHAPALIVCNFAHFLTDLNNEDEEKKIFWHDVEEWVKKNIALRSARFVYKHKEDLWPGWLVRWCVHIVQKLKLDADHDGRIDVDQPPSGPEPGTPGSTVPLY
jgi:hypothetical protein